MNSKTIRNVLISLLGFLGLGAIGGGGALIISPNGEMMGLPLSEFGNMPFQSFLIPGIILLTLLGITPILLIPALIKKPKCKLLDMFNIYPDMHWSWTFSIYVAFVLIGWIQIQLIFLQSAVFWLHTFYVFYSVVIITISLFPQIRNPYRKNK